MSNIKLNFINQSNDANNSEVVIFQKNVATNFDEQAVAWKVIKNCGRNDHHPFTYPLSYEVAAADSYGNITNPQTAAEGQQWHMERSNSGDVLNLSSEPATSQSEVAIANKLDTGSIDAQIYKNGKLLAAKTGVSPQQKATFEFKPTLWVGVVSEVKEGEVMNSAILSDINTELSLLGVSSANIIMTGGGTGPNATPFQFHLEPTS